tara:strand:- start:6034 stop:6225 length:192 start_codon:yes stop_codon:yes gene_type:complete
MTEVYVLLREDYIHAESDERDTTIVDVFADQAQAQTKLAELSVSRDTPRATIIWIEPQTIVEN